MAYSGDERAITLMPYLTKLFRRSFIYDLPSMSYSFGTQENFIFVIGDYLRLENYAFVESNLITQGSEVLKAIMESQMALTLPSGNWYAILNKDTGFEYMDVVQFKRMVEFMQFGEVKDLSENATREEFHALHLTAKRFKATHLEDFCTTRILEIKEKELAAEEGDDEEVVVEEEVIADNRVDQPEIEKAASQTKFPPKLISKMAQEIMTQVQTEVIAELKEEVLTKIRLMLEKNNIFEG